MNELKNERPLTEEEKQLCEDNIGIVYTVVGEMRTKHTMDENDADILLSELSLIFMRCAKKWNHTKFKVKFSDYAFSSLKLACLGWFTKLNPLFMKNLGVVLEFNEDLADLKKEKVSRAEMEEITSKFLSERENEVLWKYFEGYDTVMQADEEGCTKANISKVLNRAIERLRFHYSEGE